MNRKRVLQVLLPAAVAGSLAIGVMESGIVGASEGTKPPARASEPVAPNAFRDLGRSEHSGVQFTIGEARDSAGRPCISVMGVPSADPDVRASGGQMCFNVDAPRSNGELPVMLTAVAMSKGEPVVVVRAVVAPAEVNSVVVSGNEATTTLTNHVETSDGHRVFYGAGPRIDLDTVGKETARAVG